MAACEYGGTNKVGAVGFIVFPTSRVKLFALKTEGNEKLFTETVISPSDPLPNNSLGVEPPGELTADHTVGEKEDNFR